MDTSALGISLWKSTEPTYHLWISQKYVWSQLNSIIVFWDTVSVSDHVHFPMKGGGERNSRRAKYYTLILGQSCLLCWLQWRWREFKVSLLMSCSYAAWPNRCKSALLPPFSFSLLKSLAGGKANRLISPNFEVVFVPVQNHLAINSSWIWIYF